MYIKKLSIIIVIVLQICCINVNAEQIYIIDMDHFSPEFEIGYYWPNMDEVYNGILSQTEVSGRKDVIITCMPEIRYEYIGWTVIALFPDTQTGMMIGNYATTDSDEDGVWCSGLWRDECTINEYYSHASEYSLIKQKTDAWICEYGPWMLWDYTIKADFFSKYNHKPITEPFFFEWYNEYFRNLKCGLPDESHPFDMAKLVVERTLLDEYCFTTEQIERLGLDARYIIHETGERHGHWDFYYWVKLKKDEDIYWANLCWLQVLEDGSAIVMQGPNSEMMSMLMSYAD